MTAIPLIGTIQFKQREAIKGVRELDKEDGDIVEMLINGPRYLVAERSCTHTEKWTRRKIFFSKILYILLMVWIENPWRKYIKKK